MATDPTVTSTTRVEIRGAMRPGYEMLNSGAKVFMADCEDSLTPTWDNVVQEQINLRDAVNRSISFTNPDAKQRRLNPQIATLIVRPRGWQLFEKHIYVDGRRAPGAFVDFGLYLFHNHAALKAHGTGPYFYLPKLENHLEAKLWAEVFRPKLLIRTCHRRGAFAMGGMAPQIPIKNDSKANEEALAKVRADKEREAGDGDDGTWVAHPGLVPLAMEVFAGVLEDGRKVTAELFRAIMREELGKLRAAVGEKAFVSGNFERAAALIDEITTAAEFERLLLCRPTGSSTDALRPVTSH